MNLGKAVREIRMEHLMTQDQLSEKTNLYKGTIYMLEANRCNPRFDSLCIIADALGVKVSDIVRRAENV